MKGLIPVLICLSAGFVTAQHTFFFDFAQGQDNWTGDFADYPVGEEVFYELAFQWEPLPSPLDPGEKALKIAGNNHSDDLFMFIKRKITGLLPNKAYQVVFDIQLASIAPTNAIGVGGAPGEAVVLKAGATRLEPMKVNDGGFYHMNIDKSNQSQPGADMDTIGHIGVTDTTSVFTLISRNNFSHPFSVTTDENGEVWVVIGADSGYEGLTTLYFNTINITFTGTGTGIAEPPLPPFRIYPNPGNGLFRISGPSEFDEIGIFDITGKLIKNYPGNIRELYFPETLPRGTYLLKISKKRQVVHNQTIIIK